MLIFGIAKIHYFPVLQMTAYYDKIAAQYKASKTLPFRKHVEWFSYKNMLGSVTEKSILDLACGEGFYTRRLKQNGAAQVVGVDLSDRMIELARNREDRDQLGIQYIVCDVMDLDKIGDFDLVVASYLLNYARTREQLLKMCQTISVNLKAGGRFVSINNNPDQPPESFPICKKYGFTKSISEPLAEGAIITYHFFRLGQAFHIENYYLSRNTHTWAFKQVGFNDILWKKINVSAEGIQQFGQNYWKNFLDYEPIVGIVCKK
jgi:ubiquinone/menaquinone biosynthesis C-methylase UbiE